VGTPVAEVLRACEVSAERAAAVVLGGPMTGVVAAPDARVEATTIGVLALTEQDLAHHAPGPCIRCGRCADACPFGLPAMDLADRGGASTRLCIACGACQFVCPAGRPLVSLIREAPAAEDQR
jgi:electron transport complex protein RnfC